MKSFIKKLSTLALFACVLNSQVDAANITVIFPTTGGPYYLYKQVNNGSVIAYDGSIRWSERSLVEPETDGTYHMNTNTLMMVIGANPAPQEASKYRYFLSHKDNTEIIGTIRNGLAFASGKTTWRFSHDGTATLKDSDGTMHTDLIS